MKTMLLSGAVAVALASAADTIPFWGDASPATNRTSAASASAAPVGGFESRVCVKGSGAVVPFSSERLGMYIIVR
jgi:hypothetical protein